MGGIGENMEKYKRSKTDSSLYCPYCGHGFSMNYKRSMAMYEARSKHEMYAKTDCRYCHKEFLFINCTPEYIRNTGIKAVKKLEMIGAVAPVQ